VRRFLRSLWLRLQLWDLENQAAATQWKLEQDELDECVYEARMVQLRARRAELRRQLGDAR
jgi:cell division protein FtsB